jgi:hypothetical protein
VQAGAAALAARWVHPVGPALRVAVAMADGRAYVAHQKLQRGSRMMQAGRALRGMTGGAGEWWVPDAEQGKQGRMVG